MPPGQVPSFPRDNKASFSLGITMPKQTTRERQGSANRAYGSHLLTQHLEHKPRGTKARLAEALGVSAAHVTNLSQGIRGMSDDLVSRLVENFLHKEWAEFEREAREWMADQPERQRSDDASENRPVAARLARQLGLLDSAVAAVLAEPVPTPEPTAKGWLQRMMARDEDLRIHASLEKRRKASRRSP